MYSSEGFIGCPCGSMAGLIALSDKLNAQVVERVNETQELVMLNNISMESDEMQFRRSVQNRIAEVASWRWVLTDLSKRLGESVDSLSYEQKALRVVVQRIRGEVDEFCRECSRPGALDPCSDSVEIAIIQEMKFLKKQRSRFEELISEVDKQVKALNKTKQKIENDVAKKEASIEVDEECSKIDLNSVKNRGFNRNKKKKLAVETWEDHCRSLKIHGLRALSNAIVIRQQLRGARAELSVAAQAYAVRVDAALRRRLHTNHSKLKELAWQREEAVRDLHALEEELNTTEKSLIENMEQNQVVTARIKERMRKPNGELLTNDEVDRQLKSEQGMLKRFERDLNMNLVRIKKVQNDLIDAIAKFDSCGEDILNVISLDEDRIRRRNGEIQGNQSQPEPGLVSSSNAIADPVLSSRSSEGPSTQMPVSNVINSTNSRPKELSTIAEVDEREEENQENDNLVEDDQNEYVMDEERNEAEVEEGQKVNLVEDDENQDDYPFPE